jgi:hypothetical protein
LGQKAAKKRRLGGKRQSKKRDSREGRGGARLARFLRRGHPAVFGPFAGACGRWAKATSHLKSEEVPRQDSPGEIGAAPPL